MILTTTPAIFVTIDAAVIGAQALRFRLKVDTTCTT